MSWLSEAWDSITGKSQKDALNNANELQARALNAQTNNEAFKQGLITDRLKQADTLRDKYMGQADTWTKDYLNYLRTSPDPEYNASRTAMERGITDGMNQATKTATAMGRGGGGILSRMMGDLAFRRAGLVGNLEAQRQQNVGNRLGMGTQLLQSLLTQGLNLGQSSAGMGLTQNTQVPQMLTNQANYQTALGMANNPMQQAASGVIGNYVNSLLGMGNSGGIGPNDVAVEETGSAIPGVTTGGIAPSSGNSIMKWLPTLLGLFG